ncbi:MAG: DUF3253 domain-containing protein [Rhodospirillaceae bacterium]|nr:DUF3253 domain-containing protein [Rhodospirillaceae bacterium]
MTETEDAPETPQKDDPIATTILEMLGDAKSLNFKDVAMAIAETKRKPKDRPDLWRRYINAVKQQSVHLARQGRIEIVRKGEVADPSDFKGIVRIRLVQK